MWGHHSSVVVDQQQKGEFWPGNGSLFFISQVCALETEKLRKWNGKAQEKVVLDHVSSFLYIPVFLQRLFLSLCVLLSKLFKVANKQPHFPITTITNAILV